MTGGTMPSVVDALIAKHEAEIVELYSEGAPSGVLRKVRDKHTNKLIALARELERHADEMAVILGQQHPDTAAGAYLQFRKENS